MVEPQGTLTLNFIHLGGCHIFPQLKLILKKKKKTRKTENCVACLALVTMSNCGPSWGLKLHGKYGYDIGFSITTTLQMSGTW